MKSKYFTKTGRFGKVFALFTCLALMAFNAGAQVAYKIMPESTLKVSGTSTLHDWSMAAGTFTCEGSFVLKNGKLQNISSMSFNLPVTNLKSKEKSMDTKAYKALKSAEFTTMNFKLTSASIEPQNKITATGKLTIAGVTNEVSLQSTYVLNSDESITCNISKLLKMSDYKIKPPTFMLGTIKTGDAITVDLFLKFKKGSTLSAL